MSSTKYTNYHFIDVEIFDFLINFNKKAHPPPHNLIPKY